MIKEPYRGLIFDTFVKKYQQSNLVALQMLLTIDRDEKMIINTKFENGNAKAEADKQTKGAVKKWFLGEIKKKCAKSNHDYAEISEVKILLNFETRTILVACDYITTSLTISKYKFEA